jgi:hypothetical protein
VQFLGGKLLFSASDLVNFLGCRHATYLDLRSLADEVAISERDTLRLVWIGRSSNDEAERDIAAMPSC